MPTNALRRYLQDHLAGSVAALQLMETLGDHERGLPLEPKLRGLHYEVTEEQERLKAILARLEGEESSLKRATALQARTLIQHAMVEQERMAAARAAFRDGGGSSGSVSGEGSGDTSEWGA